MLKAEIERIAREAAKTICDDNAAMLPTQFRTAIQHNTGVTASHIYRAIVSALRSDVVGYREALEAVVEDSTFTEEYIDAAEAKLKELEGEL